MCKAIKQLVSIAAAAAAEDGVSGVEFAGYSNDLTNLADARTDQSGQAIAFPNNLVSPLNPLTCTQVCGVLDSVIANTTMAKATN